MKASEARIIAINVNANDDNVNYADVLGKIKVAANHGKFECEIAELRPGVRDEIEKLGYIIKYRQSGINEYSYNIAW